MDWKTLGKHFVAFVLMLFFVNLILGFFGLTAWLYSPYTKLFGSSSTGQ